jgi:hypothetical protein
MAALSDSRLVWSATLVIVVTTWLMLVALTLSTASLELIEPAASMTCPMVSSIRARPVCPLSASTPVCSADLGDLVHGPHQILRGRGDLLRGGADLGRGRRTLAGRRLLLLGGGGDLGDRRVDLNARLLDVTDEQGHLVDHPVEAGSEAGRSTGLDAAR